MKSRRDNAHSDEVAQREQKLWNKAQPRYDSIMERHLRLPTIDGDEERELDVRKKRLVYRSKQRGWLEVDLLLGTWASENVASLSVDELNDFEQFVNLETIDIYNVLTLRVDVPKEMQSTVVGEKSLVQRIQDWAKESPLGKADREKYVEVKTKNNLI
jgi:succinate dehydrogenase flavin-adding protein (antitoxin of CptAB toxin-antitoxin module)|eukprot:scaffold145_cov195-Alexandrium_tamarense.AAC.57